ncbi:MAG: hypothetical protein AAB681_02870 [Patescibacteria group bacterium]
MENKLTPSEFADKLEKLDPAKQHGGYIPKTIPLIIKLLRECNLESAKATYEWEADKLAYHKEIVEMLDGFFY